jgi:hypothetical protein
MKRFIHMFGILLLMLLVSASCGSIKGGVEPIHSPIAPPAITPSTPPETSPAASAVAPPEIDPLHTPQDAFSASQSEDELGDWIVVVASGVYSYQSGWVYAQKFLDTGYKVQVMETANKNIRVVVVGFTSEEEANGELPKIQTLSPKAYVRKLSEWCPNRVNYSEHILCK